jgi:hypothetical protein
MIAGYEFLAKSARARTMIREAGCGVGAKCIVRTKVYLDYEILKGKVMEIQR